MKRFNITNEEKEKLIVDIENYFEELKKKYRSLANANLKDGMIKISETKTFGEKKNDDLTKEEKDLFTLVTFCPMAFAKMVALIEKCATEIAWYGLTKRIDDEIIIEDIIVYDQTVTGGTVDSTEEQQIKFFNEQSYEVLNAIHCQMHSHVNFGCSPSGTDEEQQEETVRNLDEDKYYLFMIWNKKLEHYAILYDRSKNLIYEDEDILVDIATEDQTESAAIFAQESMKKVEKKTLAPVTTTTNTVYSHQKSNCKNDYEYSEGKWWTGGNYGSYYNNPY